MITKARLEKEIKKEIKEHPWASKKIATRIAIDHLKPRKRRKKK